MAEVTSLVLAVDSRQVKTASADLDRFSKSGKGAEAASGGLVRSAGALKAAFAGVSAALVGRAVIQAADTYANLNARLKLVTRSAEEFSQVQKALFDISQRTRVGLEQTSDLFGSLARSTEALGVSQQDVLGVTETINQALLVSGTNAQSAAAALVQLGQGFASGTLRGEELNSVLEQAPRLARAIADGLGVPLGKLRELGKEGELTAEKVFQALQKSSDQIKKEFDSLPVTVDQATTQASNSILKLIGVLDEATGTSSALAEAISSAASFVSELADEIKRASNGAEDVGFLARAFITVDQTLRILAANVKFVFQGIGREIGGVAAQVAALARLDIDGFQAISKAMKEDAERARIELDAYEKRVLNVARIQFRPDDQSSAEARRLGLQRPAAVPQPNIPDDKGKKKRLSDAERYLESLQRQLQGTKDLTVAEKLLEDIQAGRLGRITKAQETELLGIALQIDAANALNEAVKKREEAEKQAQAEIAKAREAAFEASQRQIEAANDEVARLIEGNQALREEIELIGKSAEEKGRLEQARIANAIAAKEEELASLQNAGATQAEIQALQQQIALLRERRDLVGQRGVAQEAEDQAKQLQDSVKQLGLTFTSAFEDAVVGGKGLKDVLKGIEADLLRLGTRKLVTEPFLNFLSGAVGGASGGGGIFGFLAGLFGGVRANGGPVSRGRIYEINERGTPEVLNMGGRQYLMATANGSVNPNVPSGGVTQNITQHFHFSAPTDRRTQTQVAAEAQRGIQQGARNL